MHRVPDEPFHNQLESLKLSNVRTAVRPSKLSQLSHERVEFSSVLMTHVPTIQTTVRNYNFGHIITYINRLSENELKKITADSSSTDSGLAKRTVDLNLVFEWPLSSGNHQHLQLWVNRMDHPTKKGTNVDFQYEVNVHDPRRVHPRVRKAGPKGMVEFRKINHVIHKRK